MARAVAITVYGSKKDRLRVAAMAKLNKRSVSEHLLDLLRKDYAAIYGDTNPETLDARPTLQR